MKIFNGTNRTTFTNNIIPIERNNYVCVAAIDIDSVLKIGNKRAYSQAYIEQCKYKLRKRKIVILLMMKLLMTSMKLLMMKFLKKKDKK